MSWSSDLSRNVLGLASAELAAVPFYANALPVLPLAGSNVVVCDAQVCPTTRVSSADRI